MVISNKDAPDEVIYIRQAWIKAINRVAEAVAYRYKRDVDGEMKMVDAQVGSLDIIESVLAFRSLLVDYGEALVRSDVDRWRETHIQRFKQVSNQFDRSIVYREWFEFMVQTLNKYGMLFESVPRGYSNVTIECVEDDDS
jgi:hypothetical protein